MRYCIEPGIAACVTVVSDAFPEYFGRRQRDYIYMKPGLIEAGVANNLPFHKLPAKVQGVVEAHFDAVFDLPVEERSEYLQQYRGNPIIVEVSDEIHA